MMKKFSKIGKLSTAFKSLIMQYQFQGMDENKKPIYDKNVSLPTINLWGTVKLHGTNGGVMQFPDGTLQFQSREKVITPMEDNAGFATWATANSEAFDKIFADIRASDDLIPDDAKVVIYGEWAGKGIQGGVAVSELPKQFYIFDIAVIVKEDLDEKNSNFYLCMEEIEIFDNKTVGIYNLWDRDMFPVYEIQMDLENPKLVQNELIKITDDVEAQCPVGLAFEKEGIGEGVVWRDHNRVFICKIKGDKHAGKSKVRRTNIVDVEKLNSVNEFVERFADIERLNQGWDKMIELDFGHHQKHTGDFVRWMINDIVSEETDTLAESGLTVKDVGGAIGKVSSRWFLKKLDEI